jgi:hypothetical protein
MAISVDEIMNRELFSLRPVELASDALRYLVALGVGGCPVLDDGGMPVGMISLSDLVNASSDVPVRERMSAPIASVREAATIREAATLLSETGYHRLVVVDEHGRAVGIVSSIDVVRGLVGMPARHPAVFPHYDERTHMAWTDDTELDFGRIEVAPDGPGVVALIHGGAGRHERVVWAEATQNVRTRLIDMLSSPQDRYPALQRWLDIGNLRFRAASQIDAVERRRVAEQLLRDAGKAPPRPN